MTRTIEYDKTFRTTATKAIKRFFTEHKDIEYWEPTFEYMAENGIDHFINDTMADGTHNKEWTYSLWLDTDGKTTYIAIIERN